MDSICNRVSLLQYEHNIVLDLVKKGHPEPDTKVCTNLHPMQLASILTKKFFTELATPAINNLCLNKLMQIGPGIRALQVREHAEMTSTCFYLLREDGTDDNFSIRKCVCKLFPKWGEKNARQPNDFMPRGGGRGSRGGGRGGARGGRAPMGNRGGRGGRRGRGRGRGRG